MGLNYTLQGRRKISQCIGDIDLIIKEFIGMQPRPLFIEPYYNRIDETGFTYNEPFPDDYPVFNYNANERDILLKKIEDNIPAILDEIDKTFKGDLIKRDDECGEQLHSFFSSIQSILRNISMPGESLIYKNHLLALFESKKEIYSQFEIDNDLWLGIMPEVSEGTVSDHNAKPDSKAIDAVSFENDVLNDAGRKILARLKNEYKKAEPLRIVCLLFALEELKLLTKSANSFLAKGHRTKFANASHEFFERNYTQQALGYEPNPDKRSDLIKKEYDIVKKLLL